MQEIFGTIIRMSLQGIVIFVLLFLTRLLLKKLRVSHTYIVGLWLILFFYLVFPWKLQLPIGFWSEEMILTKPTAVHNPNTVENDLTAKGDDMGAALEQYPVQHPLPEDSQVSDDSAQVDADRSVLTSDTQRISASNVWEILAYAWVIGVIGLFMHLGYSYIVLRKRVLLSVPYKERIYWAEEISTPMVLGVLFPKIYLPIGMEKENLFYVISHEEMHIRRKDCLWKLLAYAVCLIHWFNPLVWISYRLLGSDIEKACDEAVIGYIGAEKKKDYTYALLQAAQGTHMKGKTVFVAPVCFDEGDVKGRIKNILQYKYNFPIVGVLVTIVAVIFAIIFMTSTKAADETRNERNGYAEDEPLDGGVSENANIVRGEFENLLGYDGYYLTDQTTVFPWITSYYAVVSEESFLIAESWGMERDDYIVDIDGDGINELICNVTWGDGAENTLVYRREGNRILRGYADDLLDEEYDSLGVGSEYSFYRPEENVVEIFYWREEEQGFLSKKYEIDFEQIRNWEERYI